MSDDGDPIEVVAYDQRWVELFAVAERELRVALAPFVLEIEHIGSTAVPGLAAKPVIDIQVGVRTLDDSVEIVSAVESLGYEYVPEFEDELPDRRYFRRWADGCRSHQVHLVERSNTNWWDRHVQFRDWLRTHDHDRLLCGSQAEPRCHPSERPSGLHRREVRLHPCGRGKIGLRPRRVGQGRR